MYQSHAALIIEKSKAFQRHKRFVSADFDENTANNTMPPPGSDRLTYKSCLADATFEFAACIASIAKISGGACNSTLVLCEKNSVLSADDGSTKTSNLARVIMSDEVWQLSRK